VDRDDQGASERPDDGPAPPRHLAADELAAIIEAHRAWVQSREKEGRRAELARAVLRGADLRGADLRGAALAGADLSRTDLRDAQLGGADLGGADLHKADLSGARLDGASLRGADLSEARLRRADLARADLRDADLTGAAARGADLARADLRGALLRRIDLRDASLQDADLSGCQGLLAGQLGGAHLAGARLPDEAQKFDGLANVAEASKTTQGLFTSVLLVCAYTWMTVASTTDAQLLNNAAAPSSRLPILGTEIPLVRVYAVAPLLLLCLYVYFHLGLQRLWEEMAELPAVFPDGRPLDKKAYPWLLNALVRSHVARLREDRSHLARWQARISVLLAWGLVPLTLLFLWGRYLPGHDWQVTMLHVVLLSAAIGAGAGFLRLAAATLRGSELRPTWRAKAWKDARIRTFLVTAGLAAALTLLSYGAIEGANPRLVRKEIVPPTGRWRLDPRHWVPHLFDLVDYSPFAHLEDVRLSTAPANWSNRNIDPKKRKEFEHVKDVERSLDEVKGAELEDRNLRFASAYNVFLVNAFLHNADLRNADLRDADLRKADLRSANLAAANLRKAELQQADLRGADLTGAKLMECIVQMGDLSQSCLRGADLQKADLTGADLSGADLSGADLRLAQLEGIRIVPDKDIPRARFVRADLRGADLQDADLGDADLSGADLSGADLRGATLTAVTGLTEAQLASATTDARTRPPVPIKVLARSGAGER
jgi:uncharacterized protein YjbI with pentapeptide repeats